MVREMKLWIAILLSVLLAAAAMLSSTSIVERLSIGSVSFVDIADPRRVGTVFIAVLIGSVVYGIVVTALLAVAIILDMLAARDTLRFAPSSGQYLLRRDWEAAFKNETLKPARHRIVTQLLQTNDEHLLLAAPFSPPRARTELRAIYLRQLAVAQVWTVVGALLLSAMIAGLFSTEEMAFAMIRPILLGVVMVIGSLGITWLAVSIAVDTLTSVLAEAPFLMESALAVRSDSQARRARDDEEMTNAVPANLGSGIEAVAQQLDGLSLPTLEQTLAARLPEITAEAISTALKERFEDARLTIERIAEATDRFRLELPARIGEALEATLERISTDQVEAIRLACGTLVAEQKAIAEKIDELRRVVTDGHDLQLDVLRQLATELAELSPRLLAVLRKASAEAAEERDADSHRITELMQSTHAYAASLLPAIKRLESYDERVLRAMNQESDTLSQLTVTLNELSGTLEALRVQLGHAAPRIAATPDHLGPAWLQMSEREIQNGQSNMSGLAAELRSLLEDLDEERGSD
jgi:hypothetical protein